MREVFQCGYVIYICKTRKDIVLILSRLNNKQQQQKTIVKPGGITHRVRMIASQAWEPEYLHKKPGVMTPNLVLQKTETGGLWGLPAATLVLDLVREDIQENKRVTEQDA